MSANRFHCNHPLLETIEHDPNLSDTAKVVFKHLCDPNAAKTSFEGPNAFCELVRQNYIWLDGFPIPPAEDRSKSANRWRALKTLFTGEP